MKNSKDVVIIPYGHGANLHIRKDKIIATVNVPGSNHIDIYTSDTANPWHVSEVPSDTVVGMIWGEED